MPFNIDRFLADIDQDQPIHAGEPWDSSRAGAEEDYQDLLDVLG